MAIDDDLALIERGIRELQIDWEKFFSGLERRPPNDAKARLERLIRRYTGIEIRNSTHRFRYQSLTARYSTFAELWAKRLRALEEGRAPRGVRLPGSAAALLAASAGAPAADAAPVSGDGSPLEELLAAPPQPAARPRPTGEFRVADPDRDQDQVRSLFQQFLEARRTTGEPANVKFESFQKLISQQSARLHEKGASAVDFRLETKDGRVSLKAKLVK